MRTAIRRRNNQMQALIILPGGSISFTEKKDGPDFWDIIDTMILNVMIHAEEGR